ncbi:MAG: hypothetical protein A2Y21_03865 [Clostridiales bacterium GWC2_40_7]|nr:MAG: hypothetical protein A2Y21_03865 [Clostridiales bacterium GWC2_40_7]
MDYSVEMKVKAASWTGSVGVVARYTNSNNYYRLVYKPGTDELLIIRKKSGVAATLASVTAADLSTDVYHTFKLTLDGDKLTGYIDGEQKISYTDSSANKLVAGCIGAMAYNQYAYCDDVTVIR